MAEKSLDKQLSRKIRKPLIERKRRDRMNNSLDEIMRIILEDGKLTGQNVARAAKMQKAEALEMAVDYLKQQVAKPHRDSFVAGYEQCVKNLKDFLAKEPTVDIQPETVEYIVRVLESNAPGQPSAPPPPPPSSFSNESGDSTDGTEIRPPALADPMKSSGSRLTYMSNMPATYTRPGGTQVPEDQIPNATPPKANWRPWS